LRFLLDHSYGRRASSFNLSGFPTLLRKIATGVARSREQPLRGGVHSPQIIASPDSQSDMNISFENKVALVTGAGSGLGLATATAFAESGASVLLADWNEQAVRSAAEELAAQGHKALAIRCDVADDAQVAAMVEQTVSTFGRLDAAFNNAGVQCAGRGDR
jgi:hypothetical protein